MMMLMTIQHLHTSQRFSEATIHQGTVYLAGQLATDFSGDITQQTKETLATIDQFLEDAGSNKAHILSATIYLKHIDDDYDAMNQVWDEWLKDVKAPPRTCVEAKLYHPQVLVEITVIAAIAQ
jgi:enamine deaminase RidA (YjgF/YER057c/UK114 family)